MDCALQTTAADLANLGKPRAAQTVSIVTRTRSAASSRYVVLVTPDGAEHGEYYEVFRPAFDALERGMTPDELELEPLDPAVVDGDGEGSTANIPSPEELYRQYMARVL